MNAENVRKLAASAAPGLLALYLVSNLLVRSFSDIWLFIGWTSLCAGILLAGVSKGPRFVFLSLVLLLAFHALAIPGSLIWGTGNWELTAGVVLWMAPGLLLYLANDGSRVFVWLVPVWLIHAVLIIYQGFTNWSYGDAGLLDDRFYVIFQGLPSGLANNPNIAAGFLLFGIIYLLGSPRKWLSLPLLMALLFTGSRWGLVVAVVLLLAMVLTGAISWRPLAAAAACGILAILLSGLLTPTGYTLAGYNSLAGVVNVLPNDVGVRLAIPHIPTFLPSGVAEHPGLHNVPLRIAVENGILAAVIWVVITGWALWPRIKNDINQYRTTHDSDTPNKDHETGNHVHRYLLFPFRWFRSRKRPSDERRENQSGIDGEHPELCDILPQGSGSDCIGIPGEVQLNQAVQSHRRLFLVRVLVAVPFMSHTAKPTEDKPPTEQAEDHAGDTHRHQISGQQNNVHRWLLLTLVLLSVLDYYTWMGHLGGFWWLLIGLLFKR